MRKLTPEDQTEKLGIRVKKSIRAEFFADAEKAGLQGFEGRYFEKMFIEWKALKALAQQPEKKGGKKKGDLGPGERVGRLGSKPSTHSPATHLKQGGHGNS